MPASERVARIVEQVTPAEAPVLQVAWPILPAVARHGLAGEILEVIEPHSEADPAALLVTMLAVFGALVGSGPHALADGAEHPARIWPLIVGATSKSRKGSSWAQVRRVLAAADQRFATDRVLAGFNSGEALVDSVAGDEDRRVIVLETEYGRVLSACKREGSTLATLLRQAWDGGRLQVRSRAGTAVADNAHVTLVGHITRAELLAKTLESDALGGSLNRFVMIGASRSKLLPSGGSLDDADLGDLVRRFVSFVQRARTVGIVRRTQDAEDYWSELYALLADDEPGGLLGAVIARDSAQVLRLSVAYALLDGSRMIDVAHVQAAEGLWDFSRACAASIFGEATGDPIADRILVELQTRGSEGLDTTAMHDLFGRNVKADRIKQAVETLTARGLTKETKKTTHARGRPKAILLLAKYEENEVNEEKTTSNEPPIDDETIARWEAGADGGERKTEGSGSALCQGYEGSPKGRRIYRKCLHLFEATVRLTYRKGKTLTDRTTYRRELEALRDSIGPEKEVSGVRLEALADKIDDARGELGADPTMTRVDATIPPSTLTTGEPIPADVVRSVIELLLIALPDQIGMA